MQMRAKKRFGQHFLRDTGIINRILKLINPEADDIIVEIGAGQGALSARIAPHVSRLLAIEIDHDCHSYLEAVLAPFPSAVLIPEDILHLDLAPYLSSYLETNHKLRIVGNLPYNIATAIIEKYLHANLPITDMIFMVQFEVAERITAAPKCHQYGYFSVDCQHHATVRRVLNIPPACFVPQPRVNSSIVVFQPKRMNSDPAVERHFQALIKASFSFRRKTLANSLGRNSIFSTVQKDLLERAGIDGDRRAEELSVKEYEHLSDVLHRCFPIVAGKL